MSLDALRRQPLFFAAVFLSVLIFLQDYFRMSFPLPWGLRSGALSEAAAAGDGIFLGGVIVSEVEERDAFFGRKNASFTLDAKKIWKERDPRTVAGRVKVYFRDPPPGLTYGDEVVLKGRLERPEGARNPGGFDQKAYLERRGTQAVFYAARDSGVRVLRKHRGNFIQEKALWAKRFLSRRLGAEFSRRDAAFLQALFLGERANLEEDFKDLFIKTGTMHILAVSGFNVGFLSFAVFFFSRLLRGSRNVSLACVLAAIWLYALLVGWQAPVVRATIMATLFILGQFLGRKTNILNTLGFAGLVILFVNPRELYDAGFELSFLAVFGLVLFLPKFVKRPFLLPHEKLTWKERGAVYLEEIFWVSFVCLAVSLPVTVQNFYIVAPLSLIANVVVVPTSFLLFLTGLVYFLTFWWVPKALFFIPALIKFLMGFFVTVLFWIERLPGAYFIVGKLNPLLWVLLVAGIFWGLAAQRIARRSGRALLVGLVSLNVFFIQDIARRFEPFLKVTMLDVGQGDAIYLEFPGGGNMLVDAGKGSEGDKGRWVIAPYLKSKGVRSLDALVVSHPQEDHIGGMPTVLEEFRVKNVIETGRGYPSGRFEDIKRKITEEKAAVLIARGGMRIAGFGGAEILVLNPPPGKTAGRDANDDSLVLKVIYGDTSLLLTGDIGRTAMRDLLESGADIRSTVLKVPHHGAKAGAEGEAFIRRVYPLYSLISAGRRNPFGHPSPETVWALSSIPNNRIFRTDRDHAIQLASDGREVFLVG